MKKSILKEATLQNPVLQRSTLQRSSNKDSTLQYPVKKNSALPCPAHKYPALLVRSHIRKEQNNLSAQELEDIFYLLREEGLVETVFYDGIIQDSSDFIEMMQADDVAFYVVGAAKKDWEVYQKTHINLANCTAYAENTEQYTVVPERLPIALNASAVEPEKASFVPLGLWWLNSFTGSGAMFHFTFFNKGLSLSSFIGMYVTRAMLLATVKQPAPYEICVGSAQKVQQYIAQQGAEKFCLDALYGLTPKVYRHALHFAQNLGFTIVGALPHSLHIARSTKNKQHTGIVSYLTRDAWFL